jgi:hypothetical protein
MHFSLKNASYPPHPRLQAVWRRQNGVRVMECTPKVRHEKWGQVLSGGSTSKRAIRIVSRAFKREIVRRMLAGENVRASAREVKVLRDTHDTIAIHSGNP